MGRSILVGKKSSEKIFALAIVPLETKNPYRGVVMANEKNLKPPRTKSEAGQSGQKKQRQQETTNGSERQRTRARYAGSRQSKRRRKRAFTIS